MAAGRAVGGGPRPGASAGRAAARRRRRLLVPSRPRGRDGRDAVRRALRLEAGLGIPALSREKEIPPGGASLTRRRGHSSRRGLTTPLPFLLEDSRAARPAVPYLQGEAAPGVASFRPRCGHPGEGARET